jgi:hypothetical protein
MKHRLTNSHLEKQKDWNIVGKDFLDWTKQFNCNNIIFISHGHTDSNWLKNDSIRINLQLPNNWIFLNSYNFAR